MEADVSGQVAGTVELRVDGVTLRVAAGASLLEACDRAGAYVPRLCAYPGLTSRLWSGSVPDGCGLCLVRLGDGSIPLSCATPVASGIEVDTSDPELRERRMSRLASILAGHPHICLSCADRDGCTRDACTYGIPPAARCCSEFGRCELGKIAAFVDPGGEIRRTPVTVSRDAQVEGRIRREPGLCLGCGRCVAACETLPEAGRALEIGPPARPRLGTLHGSGCTFCGGCVLVCPAGALTVSGEKGARWLAGRRDKSSLLPPVPVPDGSRLPVTREAVGSVPAEAGVFRLMDARGHVLCIGGVADLRQGLVHALEEPTCGSAAFFQVELHALFTQRESELLARYAQEHGGLPPGNDMGPDLFADDASGPEAGSERGAET